MGRGVLCIILMVLNCHYEVAFIMAAYPYRRNSTLDASKFRIRQTWDYSYHLLI